MLYARTPVEQDDDDVAENIIDSNDTDTKRALS